MLSGEVISFGDSILISITGLAIVMIELGLLSLFVKVMSKVLAPFASDKKDEKKTAPAPVQPVGNAQTEQDDVYAAIMAAVCEESGFSPEEFVIKSIQEI